MTAEEKLERVTQYVSDELQLSWEQAQRWKYEGDQEQYLRWVRRYDVLYGVMLTIRYN